MNLLEAVKEQLQKSLHSPQAELAAEAAINAKSDEVVDVILKQIESWTPGFIDAMIEGAKPALQAKVKQILLAEAEKISDQV